MRVGERKGGWVAGREEGTWGRQVGGGEGRVGGRQAGRETQIYWVYEEQEQSMLYYNIQKSIASTVVSRMAQRGKFSEKGYTYGEVWY